MPQKRNKTSCQPIDHRARVFRQSLERCSAAQAFFERFDKRFQRGSAPLRVKHSPKEYQRQQEILQASFYYILLVSTPGGDPEKNSGDIRNRSPTRRKSVDPEMIRLWLGTLIETVRECDPQFDKAVERAWREMVRFGIDNLPAGRRMHRSGH